MSEKNAKHQCRPTGRHVDDRSTCEIDGCDFRGGIRDAIHPAINAPDHVRDRKIHGEHPDTHKDQHRCKFHPFSNRADDQSRRNNGEH